MRYTLRAVGGWSGDLLVADCEDVQESAAQEIYVVKEPSEFSCASGTLRILGRPNASSFAKATLKRKMKYDDVRGGDSKEDAWSVTCSR